MLQLLTGPRARIARKVTRGFTRNTAHSTPKIARLPAGVKARVCRTRGLARCIVTGNNALAGTTGTLARDRTRYETGSFMTRTIP